MKLICYKKCTTCKGVEGILNAQNISYEYRNIDTENPTSAEIQKWHEESGLDIKRFFNTSGLIYKQLNLKDKLDTMTLQEKYDLLATNGMLVKRPILFDKGKIYIGSDVKKFLEKR